MTILIINLFYSWCKLFLITHELSHAIVIVITGLLYFINPTPLIIYFDLSTMRGRTYSDTYQKLINGKHMTALRINALAGITGECIINCAFL